jgi:hypothetical protein
MSPLSPIAALLLTIPLSQSVSLPSGAVVERPYLFAYRLAGGAGPVLVLEEAVAAWGAKSPGPGLVRLERAAVPANGPANDAANDAANDGGSAPEPPAEDRPMGQRDAPSRDVISDKDAPPWIFEGPASAEPRFVQLDPDLDPRDAAANEASFLQEAPCDLGDLADPLELGTEIDARATLCVNCDGGKRGRRGLGCLGCHGLGCKVFLDGCQVTPSALPRTDEARLAASTALSLIHDDCAEDRQLANAIELAFVLLKGASPEVRAAALAQWEHVQEGERFAWIEIKQKPFAPFLARWKPLDGYAAGLIATSPATSPAGSAAAPKGGA